MIEDTYLWIVIVGGFASFFASMGIGANDVANAFATAVGSALTIKKAVLIASIFECLGAILMGSHVTNTIRKGIADYKCFEESPELLMYGCMCVLFAVGIWLFLASYFEMAVSTTHSCVGGMIGMTMTIKGSDCVIWYAEKSTFPYVGGVSGIVLSWFISPIMSAIISGLLYFITRHFVLRRKDSFRRTFMSMPIFVGLTLTLNTFFIIYKGAKGLGLDKTPLPIAVGTAFGIGGFFGLLIIPFITRMRKNVDRIFKKRKENEIENEQKEMVNLDKNILKIENNDSITNLNVNDNNLNDNDNNLNDNDNNLNDNDNNINNNEVNVVINENEIKIKKLTVKQRMRKMYDSINIDIDNDIISDDKVSMIQIMQKNLMKKQRKDLNFYKYLQLYVIHLVMEQMMLLMQLDHLQQFI